MRSFRCALAFGFCLCAVFPFSLAHALGETPRPALQFVLPAELRPGDPLLAWILSPESLAEGTVELTDAAGKRRAACPLFERPTPPGTAAAPGGLRLYGALIALPFELASGRYTLTVRSPGLRAEASVDIAPRAFASEDIRLDAANTAIRAQPDPRKEAEAKAFSELLSRAHADALFLDEPLVLPVGDARRSAGYGDARRYLYAGGGSDVSRHLGVDFAVPTGTQVRACAPGRVVFAAERIVTGITIVIEHLPGLYSIYMHLSAAKVLPGELVASGAPIGSSGSTGLSTGPHLHWELRANGRAVDPEYWVARAPLDKNRLIATIVGTIEGR